jgi:Helix-turn-helix.
MKLWGRKEENKFNRFIREQIIKARQEKGMTQEELAKALNISRVVITNIETGRTEINAVDLMGIAYILEKPVRYFYPQYVPTEDDLSNKEWELIHYFRKIQNDAMEDLLIDQAKRFAEIATKADIEEHLREVEERRLAQVKKK